MRLSTKSARIVLAVSIVAAAALVTPASAAAPPDTAPSGAPSAADRLSEAELQDLTRIAEQNQISLEDAIAKYSWQDDFADAVKTVSEKFRDEFAGASIEPTGGWVAFKSDVPPGAAIAFARLEAPVKLEGSRGYSELELADAINRVHFDLASRIPVGTPVVSSYDVRSGRITSEVAGLPATLLRDFGASLTRQAGHPVTVTPRPVAMGGDTIYGGGTLTTCTAGFSVISSGGTYGITTAGHCGNTQAYEGRALTYRAEHAGALGDMQWHTSSLETEADDFYYDTGVRRDVAAQGNPVVG